MAKKSKKREVVISDIKSRSRLTSYEKKAIALLGKEALTQIEIGNILKKAPSTVSRTMIHSGVHRKTDRTYNYRESFEQVECIKKGGREAIVKTTVEVYIQGKLISTTTKSETKVIK